jgi:hypothetical protein
MAVEDALDIFGGDPFGRDYLYGLGDMGNRQGLAPYGFRYAESVNQPTTAKGRGYLGNVGTMQDPMTELSASSDFGGRTVQYPLIVPTLTADELNLLRSGGEPTQEIYGKAQQYALGRLSRGQDPFATTQELRYPQPEAVDTRPYDQMQASPRGFTSGLFSDVLGGTLNMPSMPRTGIPALDLLYMNRNPVLNTMGVGDVQKTAERISYGQPLTTGSGMTLKPREETIFAGMAVAPFVGEAVNLGARAGRAGARMVGERIAENVAMGRPNLPSMLAEPRSSLFAVEPSALMPKPQAPVSELGFYSAAEQAALNLPRNKGTGQAFLNDLMKAPDVKKDELSWIGLDDFLKDKPNVTKQEVQDFIASNKIDLQEVRLGEPPPYDKIRLATLENELSQLKEHPIDAPTFGEEKFNELLKLQNIRDQSTVDSLYRGAEVAINNAQRAQAAGNKELANKYFLESEMFNTRAEALDLKGLGVPNPTRYSNYQLAGGENYREILLKIPENMSEYNKYTDSLRAKYGQGGFANLPLTDIERARLEKFYANEDVRPYQSSHFNEPNILAHIRVNDRIDADGKKMLLVEELQSDWHQAGREKGYKGQFKDLPNDYKVQSKTDKDGYAYYEVLDPQGNVFAKDYSKGSVTNQAINRLNETVGGVPDAPFKDTWYQLSLKRIMKYAADNGYERVGLTTGEQQAKRYDLSKQVDELLYKKNADGTYQLSAQANGRGNMLGESIPENKLSDYVGKEVATKIAENSGRELNLGANNQPKDMWKGLSGIDLKVGGEGMKKYYDEIYPKFLEKYGKKWDAGVGETKLTGTGSKDELAQKVYGRGETYKNLPSEQKRKIDEMFLQKGEPIRYIDITPKMKEGVKKGQPLAAAEQTPEMLASGGLDYADPFRNPLLESSIG